MPELNSPHDKFFKELLGKPATARDFVTHYLPSEIVAMLDLDTLQVEKDTFIDDELRESFSDLLYSVRWRSGAALFIYLLFEHKRAPDKWVAFQLLRYLVRFWEQKQAEGLPRLPAVFPLVVYHGVARWQVAPQFSALIEWEDAESLRPYTPDFAHYLCDLSAFTEEELKGEAILRVGLAVLKHIFSPDLGQRLAEAFVLLRQAPEQSAIEFLRTVLVYLSGSGERINPAELKAAVLKAFEPNSEQEGAKLMDAFQEWIDLGEQRGIVRGRQEGREEGRLEALRAMTVKQLQHRFGLLAEATRIHLAALPVSELDSLSDELLDFTSPADLTQWLQDHPMPAPVVH